MKKRPVIRYSSLTSLLDVLFILMFASLMQAASLVEKARASKQESAQRSPDSPTEKPSGARDAGVGTQVKDAGVVDAAVAASVAKDAGQQSGAPKQKLYDQAIATLTRALKRRRPVYVHVTSDGVLDHLEYEADGQKKRLRLTIALIQRDPDPDVEWVYRADSICATVKKQLGLTTLADELIIISLGKGTAAPNKALIEGLQREPGRCVAKGLIDFPLPPSEAIQPGKPDAGVPANPNQPKPDVTP